MAIKNHSICSKSFIAIEAVLYISCKVSPSPVRSKEICQYQGVSVRYLEHMLQKLVHDGILKGVRGPKGGYVLAKERRKIYLSDIYQSIESLEQLEKWETKPSQLYNKVIAPLCDKIKSQMLQRLGTITIQDMCEEVTAKGITIDMRRKGDFSI
jgi:Rrf2 family protein